MELSFALKAAVGVMCLFLAALTVYSALNEVGTTTVYLAFAFALTPFLYGLLGAVPSIIERIRRIRYKEWEFDLEEVVARTIEPLVGPVDAMSARLEELRSKLEEMENVIARTVSLREYYLRRLKESMKTAPDGLVSLIVVDLDKFQHFLSIYGADKREPVISHMVSIAQGLFEKPPAEELFRKPPNEVIRLEDDNMLVILPGVALVDAIDKAEALRKRVEETPLKDPRLKDVPSRAVTISAGVAATSEDPSKFWNPEELYTRAATWLQEAKDAGRNRVEPKIGT